MPVGTPFEKGQSGNPTGLPKGTVQLSTRIQRILEGEEVLPANVQEAVKALTGGSKKPVDAIIIAAVLNALKGDKSWAEWLSNNGYGKPKERHEHTGGDGGPIAMTFRWQGEQE